MGYLLFYTITTNLLPKNEGLVGALTFDRRLFNINFALHMDISAGLNFG